MQIQSGKLFLIPTFLSPSNNESFVSEYNKQIIFDLRHFIVENVKTARRFLRSVGFNFSFDEVVFMELNKHTELQDTLSYLDITQKGKDIGLLSEAGMPCIADPGANIVTMAHAKNVRVVPLAGASSILMALIASGMNGQNFAFNGYLPLDKNERLRKIRELERLANNTGQTQIFMETPYRNNALMETLVKNLNHQTRLAIAADISDIEEEFIRTKHVIDWVGKLPDLHKRPTIFLISI